MRLLAFLITCSTLIAAPCRNSDALKSATPLNIGVRFNGAPPEVIVEVTKALDYWSTVIQMSWHVSMADDCALDIVSKKWSPDHKGYVQIGGAHFPWSDEYDGIIRYTPRYTSTKTFIHEFGHLMGLTHSTDSNSVMYWLADAQGDGLTIEDIVKLSMRHKLCSTTPTGRTGM